MTAPVHPASDFSRQRTVGIVGIAIASLLASGLWLAVDHFMSPLPGMDTLGARMLLTLKCCCAAVLFCLVTGVEAVAHERLTSPAFDPLVGFETRRLRINQRYLQNTVEQIIVFAAALFGLAAYCPDGSSMRAVVATTVLWIVSRGAFWIGYHHSAALRGLGAPGMAISMIVLLYVTSRFGYEIAGTAGAVAPLIVFFAIEAVLFWGTRPLKES
ncbi:MAPEG family protein [Paraburkholderia fungorum]|uniref:MAPEG superfamily protein n=1 Tax=Paraburkholderia fungorum TaxID=134537 RepID=A0AAW3URS4_9BURK|nr:MAPEG family protein [Paraburkholderia fungorum]MBB4513249.1 putative MAPEG superfamily protein [Paraburkholderia fungorum]MBB6201324.1 putative MAPEG superfamily protein [Paraburkholderia fungorum]